MNGTKDTDIRISTGQAVLAIVLSIVILAAAQILSLIIGNLPVGLGIPVAVGNLIAAILYVIFAFAGVSLLCKKLLKMTMDELRIPRFRCRAVWLASAILMPAIVLLTAMLTGGHWVTNTRGVEETWATVIAAVAFFGLATGIVEELVFRGVIMGCLEKRFNIKVAVIVPSVLFGLLHIIGNNLGFVSIIQLLAAGSIVGILFSLIAYESDSIWNNAIVHGFWNMAIIGGILSIGSSEDSSSMFHFVLENRSFLLSGGDFGIEASIISIAAYLLFILLAIVLLKKKKQ